MVWMKITEKRDLGRTATIGIGREAKSVPNGKLCEWCWAVDSQDHKAQVVTPLAEIVQFPAQLADGASLASGRSYAVVQCAVHVNENANDFGWRRDEGATEGAFKVRVEPLHAHRPWESELVEVGELHGAASGCGSRQSEVTVTKS